MDGLDLTSSNNQEHTEEHIEIEEEVVLSVLGAAASRTLKAKENLHHALSEALDASYNFGYELGMMDTHEWVITKLSNSDTDFGMEAARYLIANPRDTRNKDTDK